MFERFFAWMRSIHDRYARIILAGIATLILPMMVLTTVSTLDNWRQDKERDRLLACFDEYAAASSTASVEVREASVVKDAATAARDLALRDLTGALRSKDEARARAAFARLDRASGDLVDAQAALDEARAENPVPPPPSQFCSTD